MMEQRHLDRKQKEDVSTSSLFLFFLVSSGPPTSEMVSPIFAVGVEIFHSVVV